MIEKCFDALSPEKKRENEVWQKKTQLIVIDYTGLDSARIIELMKTTSEPVHKSKYSSIV